MYLNAPSFPGKYLAILQKTIGTKRHVVGVLLDSICLFLSICILTFRVTMAVVTGFYFGETNYGMLGNMICYQGSVGRPFFRVERKRVYNKFKHTHGNNSGFWIAAIDYGIYADFNSDAKARYLDFKDRPSKVFNIYLSPPAPTSYAWLKWSWTAVYESGRPYTGVDIFYKVWRKPKTGGVYEWVGLTQAKEYEINIDADQYDYAINVKVFEPGPLSSYSNLEYYSP
jgi:hypothetical protein